MFSIGLLDDSCSNLILMLQKEHIAIRARKNPEDPINYDDYKSMRFTRAVSI